MTSTEQNINFEELQQMEEDIEESILEISRQMKFMATRYDYHFKNNIPHIMEELKGRIQTIITFYTSVLKAYEALKDNHNTLQKQIDSFETLFSTLIEKYDLVSLVEEDSVNLTDQEENKENSIWNNLELIKKYSLNFIFIVHFHCWWKLSVSNVSVG